MRVSFARLKWVTVVIPTAALALYLFLAHFVLQDFLDAPVAFVILIAVAALAIFLFSSAVFRIVERLEQQIIRQNRELSVVSTIATALSEPLGLQQSLQASLDTAMETMGATGGVICILDKEAEELHSAAHRGLSPEIVERVRQQKLADDAVASEVVESGRPVIIAEAFEDGRVAELCRREGYHSVISVPVKSEGNVVGVLGLAAEREGAFSEASSQLLQRVGQQVGIAVEKATLFRALVESNRELTALNEVATAVSSTLDMDRIMSEALARTLDLTGASGAEIWLPEDGHSGLSLAAQEGSGIGDSVSTNEALCQGVAESGKPAFTASQSDSTERHMRAVIPLKAGGATAGVMCLSLPDRQLLPHRQKQLLEAIAAQISVAIKNAQLYGQVQDMAILEERDRIGREMHDGLAQVLGYVNTKAFAVRRLLADGQLSAAEEYLAELEEAAREVYADVREGVLGLRTEVPGDESLLDTLEAYLEKFGRLSGMNVQCEANEAVSDLRLAVTAEIQVLRIVQEALSNVRKHARANEARVSLTHADGHLIVAIEDDGRGFDVAKAARGDWPRFGLQTMRERTEAIGGAFEIASQAGSGTRVKVSIPLAEANSASRGLP